MRDGYWESKGRNEAVRCRISKSRPGSVSYFPHVIFPMEAIWKLVVGHGTHRQGLSVSKGMFQHPQVLQLPAALTCLIIEAGSPFQGKGSNCKQTLPLLEWFLERGTEIRQTHCWHTTVGKSGAASERNTDTTGCLLKPLPRPPTSHWTPPVGTLSGGAVSGHLFGFPPDCCEVSGCACPAGEEGTAPA